MELFGNSTSIFTKTPTGLFYLSPVATSSSAFYLDVHSNWATFGDGFIIPVILSEPFSSLMKPNVLRQTTQLIIERQTWLAGDAPVQFPQCTCWLGRCKWLIHLVVARQYWTKCCTLSKIMTMGPNKMRNDFEDFFFQPDLIKIPLQTLPSNVGVLGSRSDSFSTTIPSAIWGFGGYSFQAGKRIKQSDRFQY